MIAFAWIIFVGVVVVRQSFGHFKKSIKLKRFYKKQVFSCVYNL
jgi:hypothetical protein